MRVDLPCGTGFLSLEAPEERIIRSRLGAAEAKASGRQMVAAAMAAPIGSEPLYRLAEGKRTATVIVSDHTRPVPSRDIVPLMLEELRRGNPEIAVTLLVATGCHRGTTAGELRAKLGDRIMERERIVVHDAFDPSRNVEIGRLPSGACLTVDRAAAETELLVAEGLIEPHFFAGFSGGRKSVLPGVCGSGTVFENHCGAMIDSPLARTGVLEGNPVHRDMEAAAELAGLQYIVNVAIDDQKRTAAAFAGDFREAHAAGVRFLRRCCEVRPVPGDVVVTTNGGAPLDQNLYQCVKGLTTAEATAKPGGVLILCAGLADGLGGRQFYQDMCECESPAALYQTLAGRPRNRTVPDQWQTQILCRILREHRVILVTRGELRAQIEAMKLEYAPDLDTALRMAGGGELTVVPDGVAVCIRGGSASGAVPSMAI